jgi:hemolysin activation/secretion protein
MFHCRGLVAVAIAALSFVALAQQPPRPDAGSILQQQQPRDQLPVAPSDKPVIPQVTPAKPALPISSRLNVAVKQFRFTGNTVFSSAQLAEPVSEFVGKTLDFEGLNDAAGRVQRYYRDRGYFLAVAYLPQQEIRDGNVEIAVLEGRVGAVNLQIEPGTKLRESFVHGILDAHLKRGDVITERTLERPLLLLRDLPEVDVTSELGPSKTEVGAADVTVKLAEKRKLATGFVGIDNHGNRFTGEYRGVVNLNASDFTGYGDLLSFYGFLTDENMKFGRLSYVIPVGHYGTRLGVSYTDFSYALAKDFAALGANGDGQVYNIYALHPVLRTRNANFFVQGALEHKKLEDRRSDLGSVEDRKVDSAKLGAVGDGRDRLFSGGLNAYSLTYTYGHVNLTPATLQTQDVAPGTGPHTSGDFSKVNVDLRRLQRVTDSINLLVAGSGQLANKNLITAEKISLGGPNGVRAYPVGEAPGDTGVIINTELRYIIPNRSFLGGDIAFSAFYDAGWVKSVQELPPAEEGALNHRTIGGYGLGASLGREGNFLVRGYLAWRAGHEPPQSDTAKRVPRIWLQAVKWF